MCDVIQTQTNWTGCVNAPLVPAVSMAASLAGRTAAIRELAQMFHRGAERHGFLTAGNSSTTLIIGRVLAR